MTGGIAIGVDIGGTFTDVVAVGEEGLTIAKVPSSRSDPSSTIREVLTRLLPEWGKRAEDVVRFTHGTTVATNAVLERRGARIGVLATDGFTDVIEIGRQSRHQIYDLILKPETPGFLAPGARRKGVVEEIAPTGEVVVPLDEASLKRSVDALIAEGVEAIAVCFLFSFANPVHELRVRDYLREHHPDVMVSLSSEVDPSFREYERTCVTAFDAYVKPTLDRYLLQMEGHLAAAGVKAPLQIIQSRGGICSSGIARLRPVRLFLSGPAAGVIGARDVGVETGHRDIITLDIGGTSSDIALISDGRPIVRPDGLLDQFTIRVPMVDVNSIGAGGGSIAWIDAGGGLRVGPRSAGAEPGPACYGRGGEDATVTDASVLLGFLDPAYFAGGTMRLDPDLAARAIEAKVARPLGITVEQAALGIHRVINAQMAEGIRLVSIKRGIDPRSYSLLPFGGAGPLHATALARELGITTIVVPRYPGVLSASGLLSAMTEHEVAGAFFRKLAEFEPAELLEACRRLKAACAALMAAENVPAAAVETSYAADICYIGQSYALEVPFTLDDPAGITERVYADFGRIYAQIYGHDTRAPAQFVNLRVVQRVASSTSMPRPAAPEGGSSRKGTRRVLMGEGGAYVDAAIHARDQISADAVIRGPAIIEQSDTTTLIEPGWHARLGPGQNLVVTFGDAP
jgi:N-methylhydantoinase A